VNALSDFDQYITPCYAEALVYCYCLLRDSGRFNMLIPPSGNEPDWHDIIQSMMTLFMYRRFGIPKCGSNAQMNDVLRCVLPSSSFPTYEKEMRDWQRQQSTSLLQEVESLGAACLHTGTYPTKSLVGRVELYNSRLVKALKEPYAVWKQPPDTLRILRHVKPRTTNLAHMRILMSEAPETEGMRARASPHIDFSCYVELQTMLNTFKMNGIDECIASTEPPPTSEL